jgi:crotonobetaine/carnitine-CoA ligase
MTGKRNSASAVRAAIPPPTICHLLRERARTIGNRELLRFEGKSVTFGELERETNRLANVMTSLGVERQDRVAIMVPNGIGFPLTWLAVAKAGAVVVPVNINYREKDLTHVLRDSGARIVVAGGEQLSTLQTVRAACPDLQQVATFDAPPGSVDGLVHLRPHMANGSVHRSIAGLLSNDLVTIQYTSGTTGFPKGCMLTHEYWLTLGSAVRDFASLASDDVMLTAQPFYYMDPTWNLIAAMLAGAPLVILPRFSASSFWHSVKHHGVTFFYCLGTMPLYLLKQPEDPATEQKHRVRLVMCSGIPPKMHSTFERRWRCHWREAYGATELGCVLLVPLEDNQCVGSGAMGKPVPGREVKVVDESGAEIAVGAVGELLVRGRAMMLGYYNDPAATARWRRDGWARSGDLVFRDAKGYYHLVGRLKDMIRRGGENISAAELEAVLCEHPAVRAAACVAVPDELREEEVKAFIQLQPGETPDSVTPSELIQFMSRRVAAFKVPRYYEYVDQFPMTPSERVAKSELLVGRADWRKNTFDGVSGLWG